MSRVRPRGEFTFPQDLGTSELDLRSDNERLGRRPHPDVLSPPLGCRLLPSFSPSSYTGWVPYFRPPGLRRTSTEDFPRILDGWFLLRDSRVPPTPQTGRVGRTLPPRADRRRGTPTRHFRNSRFPLSVLPASSSDQTPVHPLPSDLTMSGLSLNPRGTLVHTGVLDDSLLRFKGDPS